MTHDPFNALIEETDPAVLNEGHRWVQQQFYGETMYTDYFLKFDNEAAADAVLFDIDTSGDAVVKTPRYAAIDIVGIIYRPTGEIITTDEGEVPVMAPLPGYHVNVRHNASASELEQYQVFPTAPQRIWA
jgi:hypothetical protein